MRFANGALVRARVLGDIYRHVLLYSTTWGVNEWVRDSFSGWTMALSLEVLHIYIYMPYHNVIY